MQRKTLTMGVATLALVAGMATAQDTMTDDPTAPQSNAPMTENPVDATGMGDTMDTSSFASIEEMTVGDVIGQLVESPDGDNIGEIDYVIDTPPGPEAVIGIGGFLGLGEYTVSIPLERFDWMAEDGVFVLNEDKETLKDRPEFDEAGVEGLAEDVRLADLMANAPAPEDLPPVDEREPLESVPYDPDAPDANTMDGAEEEATEDGMSSEETQNN